MLRSALLPRWRPQSQSPKALPGIPNGSAVLSSRRSRILSRPFLIFIFFLFTGAWLLLSHSSRPPRPPPHYPGGARCEPYMSYGRLEVDRDVPEKNIWRPLGPPAFPNSTFLGNVGEFARNMTGGGRKAPPTCTPPPLMRALRESLGVRSPQLSDSPFPPDLPPRLLPFLQNRTILLLGDSVSRELVLQFCSLLNKTAIRVHTGHPWDVSDQVPPEWVPEEWAQREGWEQWQREKAETARPHVCLVPEWGFAVISIFHWGMDETDHWRGRDQYSPPGLFEHRVQSLALPLLSHLHSLSLISSPIPSLIEFSTSLWDLALFAAQDLDTATPTITDLSGERVEWWRRRVGESVRWVRAVRGWEEVEVVWRSGHWPSDGSAKIDWFMGWSWDNPDAHRPFFHHNRLLQLDHAARSLFLPPTWLLPSLSPPPSPASPPSPYYSAWQADSLARGTSGVKWSEWGNMLLGQHAHQQDQLHPGVLPGAYLWGDMMLYELRDAVGFPALELSEAMPAADQ